MSATQEEFNQATPSEISPVKDNSLPNTVDQPVPSSPARFSRSGRQIRKRNGLRTLLGQLVEL